MKNLSLIFAAALAMVGCSKSVDYDVTVQNLSDEYQMMYLVDIDNPDNVIDSAAVENGVAHMEGSVPETVLAEVRSQPLRFVVPIQIDGEAITMTYADGDATITTASQANLQMNTYQSVVSNLMTQYQQLNADAQMLRAKNEGGELDMKEQEELNKRFSEMMGAAKKAVLDILNANKESLIPAYILTSSTNPLELKDIIDFMAEYKYADRPRLENIRTQIEALSRMKPGTMVTDFTMNDINGVSHKLTDFVGKGNYVLVDFWASWCGPCRREMPAMKEIYAEYSSKGFSIVGVSLDNNEKDWKSAVSELELPWAQLSDLKGWECEGAALYGVRAIPCTILFDGEGKVVASELRSEELRAKLAELYK